MGSISNYSTLSTAIANWMTRASNADFALNIGDFITFTEDRINYGSDDPEFPSPPLRVADMEVPQTTMTILTGASFITLPPDFLQQRRVYMVGTPNLKLTYVTPNQMDASMGQTPAGPPPFFTIMSNQLILPSPAATTQSIVMGYYQEIPALSTSNTTNWLVTKHPSMYLAGACLEGSIFIGDDEGAAKWARIFTGHTRAFRRQDQKGRYSGDALQMKCDVGNP